MKEHMNEEPEVWFEWVHECRLTLMRVELDWGIHMGHIKAKENRAFTSV